MSRYLRPLVIATLLLGVVFGSLGIRSARANELDGGGWSPDGLMYTINLRETSTFRTVGRAAFLDNRDGTTTVIVEANYKWASPSIHEGTYEKYEPAPTYQLNDLVDGRSESKIETSLEKLTSENRVVLLKDDSGIVAFGHIVAR